MTTSTPEQARLVRVLARGDVLALAFGAMIGWGWIVLTGTAIQSAGSLGAILAFIVGGIAILLVALPTVVEYIAPNYAVGHLWTIAGWSLLGLVLYVHSLRTYGRAYSDRHMLGDL